MRGFTTVRNVGGNVLGLKQATDSGLLPGPRVYPSGAMITVTSGHGDYRSADELPRTLGTPARIGDPTGDSAIADSPTQERLNVVRGARLRVDAVDNRVLDAIRTETLVDLAWINATIAATERDLAVSDVWDGTLSQE